MNRHGILNLVSVGHRNAFDLYEKTKTGFQKKSCRLNCNIPFGAYFFFYFQHNQNGAYDLIQDSSRLSPLKVCF